MNSRRYLPLAAAALMAGCQHRATPPEVVIQLTSALPVGFSGSLWLDGKEQPLQGMTPAELKVQAHEVRYHVVQNEDNGTLTVEVREAHHPEWIERVAASTGPNTKAADSVSFD